MGAMLRIRYPRRVRRTTRGPVPLVALVAMTCLGATACGDDAGPMPARDGSVGADGGVGSIASPAPPALTPCIEGWATAGEAGHEECEPYPGDGPLDCPDGEADLPGGVGCEPLGAACPTGDFATALPADSAIVYVLPGAAGGDGSLARPYGGFLEFSLARLPLGAIIALGAGTHEGPIELPRGIGLWGACIARTRIITSEPADSSFAAIRTQAGGSFVRDLAVDGPERQGIMALGADAELDIDGVSVTNARGIGVFAVAGGVARVRRIRVEGVRPVSDIARLVSAEAGGRLELSEAILGGSAAGAVVATHPGSEVLVEDVVVSGAGDGGPVARAVAAEYGAAVTVRGLAVLGSDMTGVVAIDEGSRVSLEDLVVRDPGERAAGVVGRGVSILQGATAELRRARFSRIRDTAIFLSRPGPVVIEDVVARDTQSRVGTLDAGRGFVLQLGGEASLTRVRFERSRDVSMLVIDPGSTLDLADVAAVDTLPREADDDFGRALGVQSGATVTGSRLLFSGTSEVAIFVGGATATLTDLEVVDVRPCGGCSGERFGIGVGSYSSATVRLERFTVQRAALCGLHLAGGVMDAVEGLVAECAIGACLEDDSFDISRISGGVVFSDNGVNLDATTLPVPGTSEVL